MQISSNSTTGFAENTPEAKMLASPRSIIHPNAPHWEPETEIVPEMLGPVTAPEITALTPHEDPNFFKNAVTAAPRPKLPKNVRTYRDFEKWVEAKKSAPGPELRENLAWMGGVALSLGMGVATLFLPGHTPTQSVELALLTGTIFELTYICASEFFPPKPHHGGLAFLKVPAIATGFAALSLVTGASAFYLGTTNNIQSHYNPTLATASLTILILSFICNVAYSSKNSEQRRNFELDKIKAFESELAALIAKHKSLTNPQAVEQLRKTEQELAAARAELVLAEERRQTEITVRNLLADCEKLSIDAAALLKRTANPNLRDELENVLDHAARANAEIATWRAEFESYLRGEKKLSDRITTELTTLRAIKEELHKETQTIHVKVDVEVRERAAKFAALMAETQMITLSVGDSPALLDELARSVPEIDFYNRLHDAAGHAVSVSRFSASRTPKYVIQANVRDMIRILAALQKLLQEILEAARQGVYVEESLIHNVTQDSVKLTKAVAEVVAQNSAVMLSPDFTELPADQQMPTLIRALKSAATAPNPGERLLKVLGEIELLASLKGEVKFWSSDATEAPKSRLTQGTESLLDVLKGLLASPDENVNETTAAFFKTYLLDTDKPRLSQNQIAQVRAIRQNVG